MFNVMIIIVTHFMPTKGCHYAILLHFNITVNTRQAMQDFYQI